VRNIQKGNPEATQILADLIPTITYKPGWMFALEETDRGQGCEGLTLHIGAVVPNSMGEGTTTILHLFPVNPCNYNKDAWEYWVLECIEMVEHHESMEFFKVDGVAPFFSDHGPGRNPYAMARIKPQSQPEEEAEPYYGRGVSDSIFLQAD